MGCAQSQATNGPGNPPAKKPATTAANTANSASATVNNAVKDTATNVPAKVEAVTTSTQEKVGEHKDVIVDNVNNAHQQTEEVNKSAQSHVTSNLSSHHEQAEIAAQNHANTISETHLHDGKELVDAKVHEAHEANAKTSDVIHDAHHSAVAVSDGLHGKVNETQAQVEEAPKHVADSHEATATHLKEEAQSHTNEAHTSLDNSHELGVEKSKEVHHQAESASHEMQFSVSNHVEKHVEGANSTTEHVQEAVSHVGEAKESVSHEKTEPVAENVGAAKVETPVTTTPTFAAKTMLPVPEIKKGMILKQGHLIRNWKNRFFVLEKGHITYYESQSPNPPFGVGKKGELSMKGVTVEVDKNLVSLNNTDANGAKTNALLLDIKYPNERQDWVSALNQHIAYANNPSLYA